MTNIVKPTDKEIDRAVAVVMRRLQKKRFECGDVTKFSAVICRDGKIRFTQWYHTAINTSGIYLSDKISDLGEIESTFDVKWEGQTINFMDDKPIKHFTKTIHYTEKSIRAQLVAGIAKMD